MPRKTLDSLAELAKLSPEQVDRFFAQCDPVAVVGLIDETPDHELGRLVLVDHIRMPAVHHILDRLSEFAIPDRIANVKGVVHFRVTVPNKTDEVHGLLFEGGTVRVTPPAERDPHVVISTDALSFLRLISGGKNAALLLLGGSLFVKGDEALALRVGGVFQVPGQPGVAVDPAEVDPVAVARVLRHVKDKDLRDVMASGFRPVVLEQVFAHFPEFLDTRKAAKQELSIGFKITGRPDGDVDRYVVHVAAGTCTVVDEPGEDEQPDATITVSGADFLKLVTGHLNPVIGVVRGTLKVKGEVTAALALHKIMNIPGS